MSKKVIVTLTDYYGKEPIEVYYTKNMVNSVENPKPGYFLYPAISAKNHPSYKCVTEGGFVHWGSSDSPLDIENKLNGNKFDEKMKGILDG